MRRIALPLLLATLLVCALSGLVFAKGPVDRITLSSNAGSEPFAEISSGEALQTFNPWSGAFLGRRLEAEPQHQQPVTVQFWLDNGSGKPEVIYSVDYAMAADGEAGYVRVPEPGDAAYQRDIQTVLRDGGWYEASPAWAALVDDLAGGELRSQITGERGSSETALILAALVAAIALGLVGLVSRWRANPAAATKPGQPRLDSSLRSE